MIVIITEMIVILYSTSKMTPSTIKYMYSPTPYLLISSMHSLVL